MGEKSVYALPGIGLAIGGRFNEQGYSSVRDIVGYHKQVSRSCRLMVILTSNKVILTEGLISCWYLS